MSTAGAKASGCQPVRTESGGCQPVGLPSAEAVSRSALPNEVAEHLRAKYTLGVRRMKCEELAVGSFNRAMSLKYAHHLLKRILFDEGFTKFRYRNAIGFEPNPSDPLAGSRRTNREAANSGGLLPPVTECPRIELATKNHLFCCLLILQHGGIRADHNPDMTWIAPPVDGMKN